MLVVMAILAIAGLANAQNSASATATANATVVCPISIVDVSNLEFGTITNSASGGTLAVAPDNTVVYTNVAATTGAHAGATPHAAKFTVGGEGGFGYSIACTISGVFGGSGATLSNLVWAVGASGAGGAGSPATSVFPCDSDGDGDLYSGVAEPNDISEHNCGCVSDVLCVGGTITLTSAASGSYVGQINAAIAYN